MIVSYVLVNYALYNKYENDLAESSARGNRNNEQASIRVLDTLWISLSMPPRVPVVVIEAW